MDVATASRWIYLASPNSSWQISVSGCHRAQSDHVPYPTWSYFPRILAILRNDLLALGWTIEGGKRATDKITRPVLFGDNGSIRVRHDWIGACHAVELYL